MRRLTDLIVDCPDTMQLVAFSSEVNGLPDCGVHVNRPGVGSRLGPTWAAAGRHDYGVLIETEKIRRFASKPFPAVQAVDARGFVGLTDRAEVPWCQSVMTVAAGLRRADRVLLVHETRTDIDVQDRREVSSNRVSLRLTPLSDINEETGLLMERIGPLQKVIGLGPGSALLAGPAIRAVIGASSR